MDGAKDRDQAAQQFWSDVEELLRHVHRRSDQEAQRGIQTYRNETQDRLGEAVYNQGEERTAKAIDGLIEHNYEVPEPA